MKWIDFGKTAKTDLPLKHDVPWEPGSSEEGLLIGLTNLIDIFSTLSESTSVASGEVAAASNQEPVESSEVPTAINENQEVISEKPVATSESSVVKINPTRKKNFFIDMFKICSRTLSKPNS